jgi:hypothetical protein
MGDMGGMGPRRPHLGAQRARKRGTDKRVQRTTCTDTIGADTTFVARCAGRNEAKGHIRRVQRTTCTDTICAMR